MPGSQRTRFTFWQLPSISCGQVQLDIHVALGPDYIHRVAGRCNRSHRKSLDQDDRAASVAHSPLSLMLPTAAWRNVTGDSNGLKFESAGGQPFVQWLLDCARPPSQIGSPSIRTSLLSCQKFSMWAQRNKKSCGPSPVTRRKGLGRRARDLCGPSDRVYGFTSTAEPMNGAPIPPAGMLVNISSTFGSPVGEKKAWSSKKLSSASVSDPPPGQR